LAIMIRKLTIALSAGALTAVALAPATQAGNETFPTKLTIEAQDTGFAGEVTSEDEDCFIERKVVLYKRKGKRPRPSRDKKVGTAIAQPNGESALWQIDTEARGKFYAYVKKKDECRAARSRVVKAAN